MKFQSALVQMPRPKDQKAVQEETKDSVQKTKAVPYVSKAAQEVNIVLPK